MLEPISSVAVVPMLFSHAFGRSRWKALGWSGQNVSWYCLDTPFLAEGPSDRHRKIALGGAMRWIESGTTMVRVRFRSAPVPNRNIKRCGCAHESTVVLSEDNLSRMMSCTSFEKTPHPLRTRVVVMQAAKAMVLHWGLELGADVWTSGTPGRNTQFLVMTYLKIEWGNITADLRLDWDSSSVTKLQTDSWGCRWVSMIWFGSWVRVRLR